MAGFLENLIRQGTDAGLGLAQGRRAGEAQQQQELIDAQKRQLEAALIQAQIARTGRQDQPDAPEVNPFLDILGPGNEQAAGAAQALSGAGRTAVVQQAAPDLFPAPEVEAPDTGLEDRVSALVATGMDPVQARAIASVPGAFTQAVRPEGDESVEPTSVFVAARQRALAAASAISKVIGDPLAAMDPTSLDQTLKIFGYGSIDELSQDMQNFGIAQEEVEGGEGLGGVGEPWESDPMAIEAIQQIEALGHLSEEEKANAIAAVKERAAGG